MKTSSAKQKGRRLSASVREELLSWAPDLSSEDMVVTPSGVNGPDIYLSPRAKEVYPFAIECKNQERINIWDALKQALGHVKGSTDTPLLAFTKNREKDIYVSLRLKDFLKLIR